MTTLAELIKQKEAVEAQIANIRQFELADAISKVKALVAEYGLTQKDVFKGSKRVKKIKWIDYFYNNNKFERVLIKWMVMFMLWLILLFQN